MLSQLNIITRFSTKHPVTGSRPTNATWFEDRLSLLERYTYRSIQAQRDQNFRWFLLLGLGTPTWVSERILALSQGRATIIVEDPARSFASRINRLAVASKSTISTRLDSDDCISPDFVGIVRTKIQEERGLSFPIGLKFVVKTSRFYLHYQSQNPFMSFCSATRNVLHLGNHSKWQQRGIYLRKIFREPLWIKIIHGSNVSNHVGPLDIPLINPQRLNPALTDLVT